MSNSWVCVDANIVVQLVVGGEHAALIADLWTAWHKAERLLVTPTLLYYEVSNALHRYAAHGNLLPEEAAEALDAALGLGIALEGDIKLHRQALDLAECFSLPAAYDAHYLALAEWLGAEFWTTNRQLVQAVQDALPWVHLVGE